jgi:hypothetical protein
VLNREMRSPFIITLGFGFFGGIHHYGSFIPVRLSGWLLWRYVKLHNTVWCGVGFEPSSTVWVATLSYYVLYGIVSHSDLLLLIYFYNNLSFLSSPVASHCRPSLCGGRKMGRSFEVDGRPSESTVVLYSFGGPLSSLAGFGLDGSQCCFGLTRCLVLARLLTSRSTLSFVRHLGGGILGWPDLLC